METKILKISKISPDQSVICILGSDKNSRKPGTE